jgi:8-oxo-dGTP diphosphatase
MNEENKFCSHCGNLMETRTAGMIERPFCTRCSNIVYQDPKVVATTLIEQNGEILMVRRGIQPGIGLWSFPGGYVDRGEIVETAAQREVREETTLDVRISQLIGVFSEEGHPVVLIAYEGQIVCGKPSAGEEVLELGFFPIDNLPPLAFERDLKVLGAWKKMGD